MTASSDEQPVQSHVRLLDGKHKYPGNVPSLEHLNEKVNTLIPILCSLASDLNNKAHVLLTFFVNEDESSLAENRAKLLQQRMELVTNAESEAKRIQEELIDATVVFTRFWKQIKNAQLWTQVNAKGRFFGTRQDIEGFVLSLKKFAKLEETLRCLERDMPNWEAWCRE